MQAVTKAKLEAELRKAISLSEFVLYYQPQYNLMTSSFDGVEALIRWRHSERGLLLPTEFIPIAEETDLILAIGEWALKAACLQMKTWREKGLAPIRVAVNVSDRQCKQASFADSVLALLEENKLEPSCLELELSENIIINDNDDLLIQMINQLSRAGILIALDDFGTGNSCVSHLNKIPVNRIKIDKSYIQNIHVNNDDAEMVKSLITFAANMNVQIVAEGVETFVQLQTLLSHECKEIQGYYFSHPLPAKEVETFLLNAKNRQV